MIGIKTKHLKSLKGVFYDDIEKCAKHFFELGLSVNNPTTEADKIRAFFRGMFVFVFAMVMLTSCENFVTRNLGGSQTITLDKGQRLVEMTWKNNSLWILTEPMDSDYVPKVKTFYEDSNFGMTEGKITIVEQR